MAAIPTPKSPRVLPDVYAKRRQLAKVEVLESEISFLQEELKSIESVQHTSTCCQEVEEFIASRPDPFISRNQDSQNPDSFWRKFCKTSRTCCCSAHSVGHAKCCSCCETDDPKPQQPCCCCCCLEKVPCQKCCCLYVVSCSHHNLYTPRLCPGCVVSCGTSSHC